MNAFPQLLRSQCSNMFGRSSMIVLQLIIVQMGIVKHVFISSLCLSCWAFLEGSGS
jgi:hypothetical protein